MQLSSVSIREKAIAIGFDDIGFVKPYPLKEEALLFEEYLQRACHGEMSYLERNIEKRTNPLLLHPHAKTMMVCVLSYKPDSQEDLGMLNGVSSYARGRDYHLVLKRLLKELQKTLPPCDCFLTVDTAPIMEKIWAQKAGLGWLGKNSLLIHPTLGSYIFIGVLLCDLEMDDYNEILPQNCGSCNACVQACPTSALSDFRGVNGSKCLSYWTIENLAEIPSEILPKMQSFWYGCDVCQKVCPVNAKTKCKAYSEFAPNSILASLSKEEWLNMSADFFKTHFKDSPLKRLGLARVKQNIRGVSIKEALGGDKLV